VRKKFIIPLRYITEDYKLTTPYFLSKCVVLIINRKDLICKVL